MSGENRRLPGNLLRKVLQRTLDRRSLDHVALPALADLQHEYALIGAAPLWRRAFVLARGYLGLWSALALCLASWPARSLRQDWLASDAPGPRLLHALAPRAAILGLALISLLGALSADILRLGAGPWVLVLLLPGIIAVAVPVVFLLGLVLALARLADTRSTPTPATRWLDSVVTLSIATALGTFALCAWVVPRANQSYREHMFRLFADPGPGSGPIEKGPRELTLGELEARIRDRRKDGNSTVPLDVEWHKKWVIPGACLLFGPLAIGLHGLGRRPRPLANLTLAFTAICLLYVALRIGEGAALAGRLPPLPALWAGDAALAVLTSYLIARIPRLHDETTREA